MSNLSTGSRLNLVEVYEYSILFNGLLFYIALFQSTFNLLKLINFLFFYFSIFLYCCEVIIFSFGEVDLCFLLLQ